MLSNDLPIKFLKDGLCNFTPPNVDQESSELTKVPFPAPDTSIEAALQPVKLFKSVGEEGGNLSSRFAVQPICLD
jgi:hypothetical protein